MVRCRDAGPARNHWFCSRAEMTTMLRDPGFRPAGFHGVCDATIPTFQMQEGGRTDATSYRFYGV